MANRANKFKSKTPTKGKRLGVVDHAVGGGTGAGLGALIFNRTYCCWL